MLYSANLDLEDTKAFGRKVPKKAWPHFGPLNIELLRIDENASLCDQFLHYISTQKEFVEISLSKPSKSIYAFLHSELSHFFFLSIEKYIVVYRNTGTNVVQQVAKSRVCSLRHSSPEQV